MMILLPVCCLLSALSQPLFSLSSSRLRKHLLLRSMLCVNSSTTNTRSYRACIGRFEPNRIDASMVAGVDGLSYIFSIKKIEWQHSCSTSRMLHLAPQYTRGKRNDRWAEI
uniref:Putative secreted protein n=1 Tax=Anopheles marajoara TaxID=58244 RepID=A0A2M4C852_9DIPT